MSTAYDVPARTSRLAALIRLRRRLGQVPATRWLIGGPDDRTAPSLRQGLLGSLMIMVGSWGVGWLATTPTSWFARTTLLNPLRVEPAGVLVCAVLLVLGSLLLVRAWLRLGQRLTGRGAGSRDVVVRACWLWSAPLMFAFPVFSRDVYSYLGQGRLLHAGLNPHQDWISELPGWFMQGADSIWAESPSPYGPLFLAIARAVWFLTGGSPEPAFLLFRGVSVVGMALCLWAVPRLAMRFGTDPGWATWVSITNPLFALYMIAGIHNDALMMGLLLCGFVLLHPEASGGRNLVGLVLVAMSIAIKPLTVIALPFAGLLMLRGGHQCGMHGTLPGGGAFGAAARAPDVGSARRADTPGQRAPDTSTAVPVTGQGTSRAAGHRTSQVNGRVAAQGTSRAADLAGTPGWGERARVWTACVVVAGVVLAAVGGLTGLWFDWVPAMLTSGDAAFPYAPFGLLGLAIGWVVDAVLGTGIRPVADVVYAAGQVLTAALVAWLALTRRPVNPVFATGLALLAAVLLAPIIQPWYLLWVLPMFAVVRRWRGWPVWTLYLMVMVLVVIGVVDQLSVAQWISAAWVRVITAVAGAVYMVFIVFLDPKTSTLFPFTARFRARSSASVRDRSSSSPGSPIRSMSRSPHSSSTRSSQSLSDRSSQSLSDRSSQSLSDRSSQSLSDRPSQSPSSAGARRDGVTSENSQEAP